MTASPRRADDPRRGAAYRASLTLLCALLGVLVVVLAVQNRRLKTALAATAPSAPVERRPRLAVGDAFQPFHALRADGTVELVAFDGAVSRTLLMVFAESCPACPAVMPTWRKLEPAFDGSSRRMLGLRLDPGGAPDEHAGFPVYRFQNAAELPFAKLTTVPLTVLLDEWGTVLWVRYGEIGVEELAELVRLLNPGE